MLNEPEVRAILRSGEIAESIADALMATIASWVNNSTRHDLGRECVIRTLAVRSSLPEHHYPLLDALVRATGLMPYAGQPATIEDEILRTAHEVPNLGEGEIFHSLQLQVFRLLLAGRNVVLSATTSVGKSRVLDAIIASNHFRKVVAIVPTIALIDETRRRLSARFGKTHLIITHPTQKAIEGKRLVYVLTQERALARQDLTGVDFFVIDEFYKLNLSGDVERAVDLNLIFHRLASAGAQFYLIGPHVGEVRGIADKFDHVFIPANFSTVALDIEYYGLPKAGHDRLTKLVDLLQGFATPTLIYGQSPQKCGEVAATLLASGDFTASFGNAEAASWLESEFPSEWIVIRALRYGIGIYHGNVPRAIQQYMVRSFEVGLIRVLICTSTLIEGVNTVAENVVIYDRRVKTSTIDHFTFRNIAGRAGRMNKWYIGKVFVLETPPEPEHVAVELPIERQNDRTPLSLLLDLPEQDLSERSKSRIGAAVLESSLSLDTLRTNRHIEVALQASVAGKIREDFLIRELLNWTGMPDLRQLSAACELIFDFIDEGRSLKGYQIFNGQQLAAVLSKLASTTLKTFIQDRVNNRRPSDSVSEAVEASLRFLRKYVMYSFPRQLSAIEAIHHDILSQAGLTSTANYDFYAARAESLYMEAGLSALDEYGVPPQTARKLGVRYHGLDTLDKALDLLAGLDLQQEAFHPFERSLLSELMRDSVRNQSRPSE